MKRPLSCLKHLLFTNQNMNRQMSAILFTLETAFHWECRGALRGNLLTVYTVSLTVYTVSYIPPLSQSDCRKFICSIIMYYMYMKVICQLYRAKPARKIVQSDQALCCWLINLSSHLDVSKMIMDCSKYWSLIFFI